ncbi:hypothetical protein [Comamonas antarctica]|uniref:hypothetical protein n=1 Tax=Comamonas antarctica TaxID=2743470 RepID=UPI0028EE1865|nr:hypothetical protein [Comamonas antarctica]
MSDSRIPLDPARDEAIRKLAGEFSAVAGGQRLDVSVGAAALFVVMQTELAKNPEFTQYVVNKLRQVITVLETPDA